MAKLKNNAVISGARGKIGKDHYVRRTRGGKTIICQNPDFSNRQFSEAQLEVQGGLKAASAYARVASKENPIYAKQAAGTDKNAYNVAVGDWFNPPVIDRIEWKNGHIRVQASDDVMVTKVTVTIVGEAGRRLEQSEAKLNPDVWWEYQSTQKGLVRVEAWDLASNVTRQEFYPPAQYFRYWEKTY